jgi:hypothetical protein
MLNEYEVHLWEDKIEKDENGKIIHHPLNSRYGFGSSHGHLTFGGHNLDKSQKLDDVRVFYLEFYGEPKETHDREEWADPLRFEVLNRLTGINRRWYLSIIDGPVGEIQDALLKASGVKPNHIIVDSEKQYGYGYGFIPRPMFEIPNNILSRVVPYCWSQAVPGYPIEGYTMASGQLDVFEQWNARPRDDQLFREVCDQTYVNFYSFPAEHCDFVFVTNKLNYTELAHLVNLDDLQAKAKKW